MTILLPNFCGGGVERTRLILAEEFKRQGHEVEFVLKQARGELLGEAQADFPVVSLNISRAREVPVALARYLRRRRPDALLVAMWPLTVIAPLAQRLSGHRCRVVVSEHNRLSVQYGGWGRLHRMVMRESMAFGYPRADAVIGVSRGVAEDLSVLAGLPPSRFEVIHNPVPPRPQPSPAALAEAGALWRGAVGARVLSVGSFKAQKNHALLLRAFARLEKLEARLMLLGKGEGEAELRRLAAELGIAERVIFAGFHPDPTPFYMTADLFVLSSNYEGFGNVIVEALACGTPVISTDCPSGPAEILEQGRHGRLVPVGDAPALAQAMAASLAAPGDPEARKARARDFAPEKAAMQYLKLLQA